MKRLKEFFWLCAGANRDILNNCPSEASKYVGIGATVFFTGIFAALAGGYALYTVFDNYWIAAAAGLVWGGMIFNLDRFIVSSMRKSGNVRREFFMALPRLILAVIISVVIAKPLELKVFDKEINAELSLMQQEQKMAEEAVVGARFEQERNRLNTEISALKKEITYVTEKRDELRRIARQEADGTGGTMKRNPGPIYQIKKANADRVEEELQSLIAKNEPLIAQKHVELDENNASAKLALAEISEQQLNGLASRMEALDRITYESSAIYLAHLFMMMLFLAIETAPVFVKLISQRGPYDFVLGTQEYQSEAEYYEAVAKANATIKKRAGKLTPEEIDYVFNRLNFGLDKS
ncbi:MAG: DUF4407 domain-containing protein [Cyclobacteriaceae bacterium]